MSTESASYYTHLTNRSWFRRVARKPFISDLERHFSGCVLDVGCGAGEFLRSYGLGVGVDNNPLLVKHCNELGLSCLRAGAYHLPFPNGSFEGVLVSNVLEHLEQPSVAVAEAARVLKSGGKLVLTVPMMAGFRHDPTHVKMLLKPDLKALAAAASLAVQEMYNYPFASDRPGRHLYFCELRAVLAKGMPPR